MISRVQCIAAVVQAESTLPVRPVTPCLLAAELTSNKLSMHMGSLHDKQAADVWALAATLVHAWTGQPPYGAMVGFDVQRAHGVGIVPKIQSLDRPLPRSVADILAGCFSMQASARPSAQQLLNELQKLWHTWPASAADLHTDIQSVRPCQLVCGAR